MPVMTVAASASPVGRVTRARVAMPISTWMIASRAVASRS
jgi:hypothetical protein